jgi:enoyl-[acyl-carrier protein] reductase II
VRALEGRVPVIASGGFADGAGLAAALALGAGAANFGTRFLATPESAVHPAYRAAVLAARVSGTRTVGRDLGLIRLLANTFSAEMERLEAPGGPGLEQRRAAFEAGTLRAAAQEGDVTMGKLEAGQSAGLIDDVIPAGELVRRIAEEYLAARRQMPDAQ